MTQYYIGRKRKKKFCVNQDSTHKFHYTLYIVECEAYNCCSEAGKKKNVRVTPLSIHLDCAIFMLVNCIEFRYSSCIARITFIYLSFYGTVFNAVVLVIYRALVLGA